MNLIDLLLLGEHSLIMVLMDEIEGIIWQAETLEENKNAAKMLATVILTHSCTEEALLLSELEKCFGNIGPISVMKSEHKDIDRILQKIKEMEHVKEVVAAVRQVMEIIKDHFTKEERVLFPLARESLGEKTLNQLGRQWVEERHVGLGREF